MELVDQFMLYKTSPLPETLWKREHPGEQISISHFEKGGSEKKWMPGEGGGALKEFLPQISHIYIGGFAMFLVKKRIFKIKHGFVAYRK